MSSILNICNSNINVFNADGEHFSEEEHFLLILYAQLSMLQF